MKVKPEEETRYEEFWRLNHYLAGGYNSESDFHALDKELSRFEKGSHANRLFYLALPPTVYQDVTVNIKKACMGEK